MKRRKGKHRYIRLFFSLLVLWFAIHITYVTWDGLHSYRGNADIAIVLGNSVYADSSLTPILKGRVDKAYQLYKTGHVKRIMVSGGSGKLDYGVSEGMAMKRYLVAAGIPADSIIEDNLGQNTYLTARNFMIVNDSLHFSSAIVVSSFYHITRSKYIMRRLGFSSVYGACSDSFFWKDVIGLIRDFFAFYKYVLVY